MQTVEPETLEDEENDFTVIDQNGKVYNQNAGMDGIVVRIDVRERKNMSSVFQEALVRRLTGRYEVVVAWVQYLVSKQLFQFRGKHPHIAT